jgi:hypothetical protein
MLAVMADEAGAAFFRLVEDRHLLVTDGTCYCTTILFEVTGKGFFVVIYPFTIRAFGTVDDIHQFRIAGVWTFYHFVYFE